MSIKLSTLEHVKPEYVQRLARFLGLKYEIWTRAQTIGRVYETLKQMRGI